MVLSDLIDTFSFLGPQTVALDIFVWSNIFFRTKCIFIKMTELFSGVFFENVFSPKGWPKNPLKWVCLAGKI